MFFVCSNNIKVILYKYNVIKHIIEFYYVMKNWNTVHNVCVAFDLNKMLKMSTKKIVFM